MPRPSRRALERAAWHDAVNAQSAAHPAYRDDRGQRPRPRIRAHRRRWHPETLLTAVRAALATAPRWRGRPYVIAEELAVQLQVRPDAVARCLQRLNLEGLVSQPQHHRPGNTPRSWLAGHDSGWAADVYWVRDPPPSDGDGT